MKQKIYKRKRIIPVGWKEIKLGDVFRTSSGSTPLSTEKSYYEGGVIPWINSGELASPYIYKTSNYITQKGFENSSTELYPKDTVLVAMYGATAGKASLLKLEACTNQAICAILPNEDYCPEFIKYNIDTLYEHLVGLSSGSARDNLSQAGLKELKLVLPKTKKEQEKLVSVLSLLDRKIELNRQINDNLEAMAKQLYDYWFVQFDFPNEEGKPYKSSGGAMVWNEDLHMSIPCTWKTCLLSDYISSNNTGDWGFDEPAKKKSIKVGCIRGADIVKLNNLPIRYIKDNNTSKLLSAWDIVIEVSGGSPTQATGRSAFVTPGVLKRNGGNLTCSNFCHAFTMKDHKASAYFYFMWRMFYDNNNMFNFEGKTSGIKNFMTDTFLANKWLDVPTALLYLFFERVKVIYEQIDNNIEEVNTLTKQRDELLPLLMNGQASVNYHLSDD